MRATVDAVAQAAGALVEWRAEGGGEARPSRAGWHDAPSVASVLALARALAAVAPRLALHVCMGEGGVGRGVLTSRLAPWAVHNDPRRFLTPL